ncbi:MAG: L-fucose mutarotase [Saccharofermentanales bacterium]
MLKGIPKILSPELVKILMEMGHGDEIIIADGNFPAVTFAKRLVRADGHSAAEIFEAILQLFPLDTYATPLYLMEKVKGDTIETPIWEDFRNISDKYYPEAKIGFIERYEFYERAKNAFAIIATGEKAQYGNIILKKGIVK